MSLKTPIGKLYRSADEIHAIYENPTPQLFLPNILSFSTEGKTFFFGGIRTPLEFWAPWRLESDEDDLAKKLGLSEIGAMFKIQKINQKGIFSNLEY